MPNPDPSDDRLTDAYAHVADDVRRLDKDRWLAALWAPESHRRHLLALYAFSAEIARIRDVVSDPLPGEIRARWWAEVLAGERGTEGGGHPCAVAVSDTIRRFSLPLADIERSIEARIFDLYDDPMPDLATLETYCDDTAGTLIRLSARVLADGRDPGIDEAARHAGRAYGLMAILRALPQHAARGQVFLPLDVLARHGLGRDDVLTGKSTPALVAAITEVRAHARRELDQTRRLIRAIPPEVAPAFLHVSLVEMCLGRMERPGHDPYRTSPDAPQWRRQLRLWRAARRARKAAGRLWYHV